MHSYLHRLLYSERFALALALCVFVLGIALGETIVAVQQREAAVQRNIKAVAYASSLRARIERELHSLLYLTSGLGSYLVVRNNNLQEKEVQDILSVLYRSSMHVRNFGIAIGYRLTYVYPIRGNESAIGLYYPDVPTQWPTIEKIVTSGKPVLTGPIPLVQGGSGLIYRVPLFMDGKYWGLLSSVIDADSLLHAVSEQTANDQYLFALRSKGVLGMEDKPVFGDSTLFQHAEVVKQDIDIPGGKWIVGVVPQPEPFHITMPMVQRLASATLGALIGWLLYLLLCHRAELAHLVLYDTLTGLPNRRLLQDRHQVLVARHRRNPQGLCVLLFFDLDGFKAINDIHGHKAGDAVLQEVAQRARAVVRANDTVARWGGDEFVILLENIAQHDLDALLIRLRETIETPIQFQANFLHIGTSIGTAAYPGDGIELEEILRIADHRMYEDKAQRKSEKSRIQTATCKP